MKALLQTLFSLCLNTRASLLRLEMYLCLFCFLHKSIVVNDFCFKFVGLGVPFRWVSTADDILYISKRQLCSNGISMWLWIKRLTFYFQWFTAQPWTSDLTALCLTFSMCKMEIIMLIHLCKVLWNRSADKKFYICAKICRLPFSNMWLSYVSWTVYYSIITLLRICIL